MPALPEHLTNALRIAWHISSWCNYSCHYCGVLVFHKRARNGEAQAHAFDYQPVHRWLDVFRAFPQQSIFLKITGGEPFLDRANFRELLAGLMAMDRYTLRIDTNGSWDPDFFRDLDKRRIQLNVSYHPGEIDFDPFLRRILAIREAGFAVTMVNFVLAPENLDAGERILARLEKEGFFVNLSAMIPTGAYTSRKTRTSREMELIESYNTPIDVHYRMVNPATKGRLCYHPAFSYYMLWDGSIKVYCGGTLQNVFTDGAPALPREAVPCPYEHCESCVEMYRALTDEPLVTRPVSLYTLDEYVEEVETYRAKRRWKNAARNLRHRLERLWGNGASSPEVPAAALLKTIQPAPSSNGNGAEVMGAIDGGAIRARSRDRLLLSGWAATREQTGVASIELRVAEHPIGVVRHFCGRPDRPDVPECGWQTMAYLPALRQGRYQLVARAIAPGGSAVDLPPVELEIVE
jgi:MoaA/NifB/PqqE/SkfB family radical SAM enzyme